MIFILEQEKVDEYLIEFLDCSFQPLTANSNPIKGVWLFYQKRGMIHSSIILILQQEKVDDYLIEFLDCTFHPWPLTLTQIRVGD